MTDTQVPSEEKVKCACPRTDARDCYSYRYAPMDDLQRADFFSIMDEGDDKCECPLPLG
jgi:hypothetical protein